MVGDGTYYVSSSITTNCPQPCYPLSYHITNNATYFTANATFILEGEHLLDSHSNGFVFTYIKDVDNLTLRDTPTPISLLHVAIKHVD